LNLKHPQAVDIFKNLVKDADVVLENYAPGVMKRLGIEYPVLKGSEPADYYVQHQRVRPMGALFSKNGL